jgi:hypothetical protein
MRIAIGARMKHSFFLPYWKKQTPDTFSFLLTLLLSYMKASESFKCRNVFDVMQINNNCPRDVAIT